MYHIIDYKIFDSVYSDNTGYNIELKGKIVFDPIDYTNKHLSQARWKKVAIIEFKGDVSEYYSHLVNKRYNIKLNRPLRGAHISFINDSIRDIKIGLGNVSDVEAIEKWEEVKKIWDGMEVIITLNTSPSTNGKHWWLIVPHDKRHDLLAIRSQLGLGKPHWGLHMSIGYANERNIEHSKYIYSLLKKFNNNYL